jgi:iron(III) transport system permease protein
MRRAWRQPAALLSLVLTLLLVVLVLMPLLRLVASTLEDGTAVWQQVLASRIARNFFWGPLLNTLALGLITALGTTLLGGFMAWLVVMTDVPGRRLIGILCAVPFALPSFAIALAWESLFRNGLIGGRVGFLQELGVAVPNWLAWGLVPVAATLIAHYFSLAFLMIGAALATINTELLEAAEVTGASRWHIARQITLPIVAPSIVASALLAFAEGVSNFAAPALLGLPVRFHTLSTRLYGAINTGQQVRGYVLAVLLILIAGLMLWASTRATRGRRAYTTITGKGGRRKRQRLGVWRWPLFGLAFGLCLATTLLPGAVLLLSSFTRRTGSLAGGLTAHYWVGLSDPAIAQGQAGVLRNPQIIGATINSLMLGVSVALAATTLGLAIGYVLSRGRFKLQVALIGLLSFLPFLIPDVAFGALYIAQFGRPLGPLPALYGTFALLVLAGAAHNLPFAAQAGRAALGQIAGELEEAAIMTGATFVRRLRDIFVPLAARGLIAGAVLVFVKIVRDLSLMVLLVTPSTPLLSVVTFRYASEGFVQFANAITIIIAAISITATLLARRLQGAAQPWLERS